jgi:hypothetical protein
MEGSYSEFAGGVFKESHCLLAPAPATIFLTEVNLVYECIPAQPLEAIAEAQDRIPYRRGFIQDEPRTAKVRISQQRLQSDTSLLSIVTIAIQSV